jgi:hypothetical protein
MGPMLQDMPPPDATTTAHLLHLMPTCTVLHSSSPDSPTCCDERVAICRHREARHLARVGDEGTCPVRVAIQRPGHDASSPVRHAEGQQAAAGSIALATIALALATAYCCCRRGCRCCNCCRRLRCRLPSGKAVRR